MASIPLPALNIRPPAQPTDPLEQFSRLQAIRDMMQRQQLEQGQQQLQQQQIQGATQENQIRQQQINDMTGIHRALNDANGDPDKLRANLGDPKYGISPNGQFSTVKMLNEYKLSQYQVAEADRKNSIDSDNTIADAYNKIKQLPLEQQGAAVQNLQADSGFLGKLTPEGRQAVSGFQYGGPDSLTTMANSHTMKSTLGDQAGKEASEAEAKAKTGEAIANTARANAETANLQGGANQAVADSRYRNIQMAMAQKQPVSAEDKAFVAAYEKQKTISATTQFNLQNGVPGASPNEPLSDKVIDAVGGPNAQLKLSDVLPPRAPESIRQAALNQILAKYPSYTSSEFPLEQAAAEKARSGSWADTRLAYNTALDHSDMLLQAADALKNNDFRTLNSLTNRFKTEFGWSGQINYNAIANAYNHEVTSVVSKGHITNSEVETGGATLPDNANAQTIHDVVNSYKSLMNSKRDELDKIIKAGAGSKANATIATGSNSQQPSGSPKVLSQAAIAQAAKDYGVSVDEVTRQAKAAGYAVQ